MIELSRRSLLGGAAALASGAVAQDRRKRVLAYTGCYTSAARNARGDGIHIYGVDAATGAWSHLHHVGGLVNPSFLLMGRENRFLYSVHGDETYATSFAVDPASGNLTVLNQAATGGKNGVHLALHPAGRFLAVANYASGNVAVLPVGTDGRLSDAIHVEVMSGNPGPHRVEQPSPRPHQVLFDPTGKHLLVPDKGLDRVFVFAFDAATGKLTPAAQGSAVMRSGSGPRHAAFHPRLAVAWVLNELGNTVATCRWDAARSELRPEQMLPSLPPEYTGENTAAEIAVSSDGRFVYCSNRGHDSIAVFSADPATGLLTPVAWTPSQGRTPRFITLDPAGKFLYAANEQSDTIVPFRIQSGKLSPAGEPIRNLSPVSIVFQSSPLVAE
jgi:6-phosphogluconolactonase (cycloisomerase 2 family)